MKIIEERAGLQGRWQCTQCGTIVKFEPGDRAYVELQLGNNARYPVTYIICPVEDVPRYFWLVMSA